MAGENPPIQDLAAALQRTFNAAVEPALREVRAIREEMHAVREEMHAVRREMDAVRGEVHERLDRQDAALRLMWRQMKGNGSFPLD